MPHGVLRMLWYHRHGRLSLEAGAAVFRGLAPDGKGGFIMVGEYTGKRVAIKNYADALAIAQYAATIPDNKEGELQIFQWAKDMKFY